MTAPPVLRWQEDGRTVEADWYSEAGVPPPRRVQPVDDRVRADQAWRWVNEGTALLWRGDYHQARQMLQALARRIERRPAPAGMERRPVPAGAAEAAPGAAFHLHRKAQGERARLLGRLLLPFDAEHRVLLRRAPDVSEACLAVRGPVPRPYLASLRELLGQIGAHEWRRRGVPVAALAATVHPHYGVFSPVRGEYLDLVQQAPLPTALQRHGVAFDVGTGTGVLAGMLLRRGVPRVVATDLDPRALACAADNLARWGLQERVELLAADLFPPGQAGLVVCNPPWLPARPQAPIEAALYDPDSRMLRGFLAGVAAHLAPGGEAWLILSDLAERLGLRQPADLPGWLAAAGLQVRARLDIRPRHGRASDAGDPLHAARAGEITSLWRLQPAAAVGSD